MRNVEVVAAIIKDGNKVLAMQRGFGDLAGGWEFPGGKIEPGETSREALAREIREELDIELEIGDPVCVGINQREYTFFSMECFLCKIKQGIPKLIEHSDARWVDRYEIDELDWLPADACAVKVVLEEGII